jgi:hypothetical protein
MKNGFRFAAERLRVLAVLAASFALACSSRDGQRDAGPLDAGTHDAGTHDGSAVDAPLESTERCDDAGEACCVGPICFGGLTCVAGVCAVPSECGDIGAPCCAERGGGSCHELGVQCVGGVCVELPCGVRGGACCESEPRCEPELECRGAECRPCGGEGESCCGGEVCDEGLFCGSELMGGTVCIAPSPCGELGSRCCEDGEPCRPGLGCVSAPDIAFVPICLPGAVCGAEGRVCCESGAACGPGLTCMPDPAEAARCRRCGELDLACCDGGACGPGLSCDDGTCRLAM